MMVLALAVSQWATAATGHPVQRQALILTLLGEAQSLIEVSSDCLASPGLSRALYEAHRRGVAVRVLSGDSPGLPEGAGRGDALVVVDGVGLWFGHFRDGSGAEATVALAAEVNSSATSRPAWVMWWGRSQLELEAQ